MEKKAGWTAFLDVYGYSKMIEKESTTDTAEKMLAIQVEVSSKFSKLTSYAFFSDSVFLFSRDCDLTIASSEEALDRVIACVKAFMAAAIKQQIFSRGSTAYGELSIAPNIMVGRPIIRAYRCEQSLAYPIVVVPAKELILGGIDTYLPCLPVETKQGLVLAHPIFPHENSGFMNIAEAYMNDTLIEGPDSVALSWKKYLEFAEKTKSRIKAQEGIN